MRLWKSTPPRCISSWPSGGFPSRQENMPRIPLHSFPRRRMRGLLSSCVPLYLLHEGIGRRIERVKDGPDFYVVVNAFLYHPVYDLASPFKLLPHAALRGAHRLGYLLQRDAVVLGNVIVGLGIPCEHLVHYRGFGFLVKSDDLH